MDCSACFPDRLCDEHVKRQLEHLKGVARARGMLWAQDARKMGTDAPKTWPAYEGKCARLAKLKVSNLSRDERVLEALAHECWHDAERWWSRRPA